jgi:RNA polymerase sigma-70 factor (ECF subfamily)
MTSHPKKREKIKFKSENDFINLAKEDSNHFAPIYKKYHEQIFRFIYQRVSSESDAADLTSQVFLKALLHLDKYEFRGFPFSSWLYKIALNETNQFYRKNKNKRTVNLDEGDIKDIIEETGTRFDNEKREKLLNALSSLSIEKLTLIEMRFFEKRAFKEIAEVLNITENNAKVRTYRVLEEMKKIML